MGGMSWAAHHDNWDRRVKSPRRMAFPVTRTRIVKVRARSRSVTKIAIDQ
jgi:hypothetical protein